MQALSTRIGNLNDQRYMLWRFTIDFNACCAQAVTELRTEILRRLGPPGIDKDEVLAWEALVAENVIPQQSGPKQARPTDVQRYAPYLRLLGARLRRRAAPRFAPEALEFSEKKTPPERPDLSYRVVVTIKTKRQVSAGYVVVQFDRALGGATTGLSSVGNDFAESNRDLGGSQLIDNKEVSGLIQRNGARVYAIRIGRSPLVPGKPIHVIGAGEKEFHVSQVTLFDE